MTIHKGRINCRQFSQLLHNLLLTHGYKAILSDAITDGRIYENPDMGEGHFYIQIKELNSYRLQVGIYESYTPADAQNNIPSAFGNGFSSYSIAWSSNSHHDLYDVNYIIHIDERHLLIYVEGTKIHPSRIQTLTYIGLPKKIDPNDKSPYFAGMTYSDQGSLPSNTDKWIALRNRQDIKQFYYDLDYYDTKKSYGHGEKLFFSPIFIGSNTEGVRGMLEGIYIMSRANPDFHIQDKDEFVLNGKQYRLLRLTGNGNRTLNTNYDYLIEI